MGMAGPTAALTRLGRRVQSPTPMKRLISLLFVSVALVATGWAQAAAEGAAANPPSAATTAQAGTNTTAAAVVASGHAAPRSPDFLEHLVDIALKIFDVKSSGNTTTHYVIAALFLVGSYLLRRVVTTIIFGFFRRMAEWGADDSPPLDALAVEDDA